MADSKVSDVRFDFSMSTSPRGQVLSRFRWIGDGFVNIFQATSFFFPFMGLTPLKGVRGVKGGFGGLEGFRGKFWFSWSFGSSWRV